MGSPDAADPFAIFHTPPPNESAGERAIREQEEAAARKVSERIDEELRQEKARLKREKLVRVLLLGQSESGKSTTLKNFRLRYARSAWDAERAAWRAVIQLNVVRSVFSVLDAVQAEVDGVGFGADDTVPTPTMEPSFGDPDDGKDTPSSPVTANSSIVAVKRTPSKASLHRTASSKHPLSASHPSSKAGLTFQQFQGLSETYKSLSEKLQCLRTIEVLLMQRLGAGGTEDYGAGSDQLGVLGRDDDVDDTHDDLDLDQVHIDAGGEGDDPRHIVGTNGEGRVKREWGVQRLQDALVRSAGALSRTSISKGKEAIQSLTGSPSTSPQGDSSDDDEPTRILADSKDAMQALWANESVLAVLKRRKVRVEEGAGFFLNDLARIATREYIPSDADVVRARLRTLGVQEYRIRFESGGLGLGNIGSDFGQDWLLYDVGGSRTMRHAWVPYFDNIQAIIFLAPVSCFDERLSEDSKVNRLEDSFLLFRKICSSKILARATMILFLNKCDLLQKKLRAGVKVRDYLPSFGERKNETAAVVKYLREKFREVLKENSPEQRSSYFYATSVIDTNATANTITAVRDSILQNYLKRADFV